MRISCVMTQFHQTQEGERLLTYASALARSVGVELILVVDLPTDADHGLVLARLQKRHDGRIRFGRLQDVACQRGTLIVTNELFAREDVMILRPFSEAAFDRSATKCLLIPFGNKETCLFAGRIGVMIAKQLGLDIVFYHTTWQVPGVESVDPLDHMDAQARHIQGSLQYQASVYEVNCRVVVEMADTVVRGIAIAAVREQAAMIVTAKSTRVLRDSYAERLVRIGLVPVLTLGHTCEEVAR